MPRPDLHARIIVFDGICHLCCGWVRFLSRHPVEPAFQHVSMQSPEGRALLVEYGIDPDDPDTFLVLDQGRSFTDSEAVIHTIAALGGLWRLSAAARIVPRAWRDWLYRLLARNRYRWFGRRSSCYLPQ
ncbi:MAG: thiol-disulfide oxidoreductase DCC family protein [Steroidobacteraceae bacterium]|jgi:predicted DCC family thiol-disulfide oxidoreductase YuxK